MGERRGTGMTTPEQALALLHSRRYRQLLVIAALLGVPVAVVGYFFLVFLNKLDGWVYRCLPTALGFAGTPRWWPLLPLLVAGIVVGLIARFVPGHGGPPPVEGLHPGGLASPVELAGIVVAAVASVGLGPVIGPEGPMIALGGGLAVLLVRLVRRDLPTRTATLISVTGAFAAISTLLGSPLIGAVFLLEASGLGGTTAAVVLLPGLLASGIGALIFTGLGSLTGLKPLSLSAGTVPAPGTPTVPELCWAVVIGVLAPVLCWLIRGPARRLVPVAQRAPLLVTPLVGLAVAGLAIGYGLATGHDQMAVLLSGEAALPDLLATGGTLPVWVLALLFLAKALAYGGSLAAFRGGPIFPAVFLGAAGGILLSHLPGLPLVCGAAIGVAAVGTGMLRLPISSLLLATLLFGAAGVQVLPLTIVATVLAYVGVMRLDPPAAAPGPTLAPAHAEDRGSA